MTQGTNRPSTSTYDRNYRIAVTAARLVLPTVAGVSALWAGVNTAVTLNEKLTGSTNCAPAVKETTPDLCPPKVPHPINDPLEVAVLAAGSSVALEYSFFSKGDRLHNAVARGYNRVIKLTEHQAPSAHHRRL